MGSRQSKPYQRLVQRHHITYDPEWIVSVFKGEHSILSRMQWYCKRSVSKGFITALRHFVKEREKGAVDLEKK